MCKKAVDYYPHALEHVSKAVDTYPSVLINLPKCYKTRVEKL